MASEGQVILPSQFGRYTLLERLASGGMAEVFRAKIVSSHGFEKIIVIKRILPHLAADRNFVSMFIDEAKLTARLTHPKIVQILDFGEVAGQYFIALEYIDGCDALALLRAAALKHVRAPLPLVVFMIAEVLDALDYAHTASDMQDRPMRLVHRDISPSNIFISRHGEVKLGDFGIAHVSERESKTQSGILKGKYGYMSPEQVTGGDVDHRSDLFAVGIVLAESFMGRRLFSARNDLDVLLMVRDGRVDRWNRFGHDLAPELDRIVRKALQKDLRARFQTAATFRDALFDYLFTQKIRVGPAELRAFMSDVFDPSPEALARVHQQCRGPSEPLAESAHPAVASAASPAFAAPSPAAQPSARIARSAPALRPSQTPAQGSDPRRAMRDPPAPTRRMEPSAASPRGLATGLPLAEAFPASALSVVDLDQWSVEGQQLSGRGSGFTPVAVSPTPRSSGRPGSRSQAWAESPAPGPSRAAAGLGSFTSAAPDRPPDLAGDLGVISAMRVFADVTVAAETGLLRFERLPPDAGLRVDDRKGSRGVSGEVKEVFLAGGAPESVNSNVPSERFGTYLVSRGVLRPAELEKALDLLPQFSGKLGDTLVGLGLMRPLEVFRHLSQQVCERVIDLFRWSRGTFAFFRWVKNERESFPLGLDGFEILGAGVLTIPAEDLERRFSARLDSPPRRSDRNRIDPDAFRLGPTPGEVLALLDGRRTLRSWISGFTEPGERTTFLRSLHLLIETDLAELD